MIKLKKINRMLFSTALIFSLALVGCGKTGGNNQVSSPNGGGTTGGNSAQTSGSGSGQLATVVVAMDNAPAEAGIILGMKLGFFEKQGIKVDYKKFASGADMLTSLAAGDVDVARTVISAGLFNASARGVDIRLVADGGQNLPDKPYFALVVSKNKPEFRKSRNFKLLKKCSHLW